MLRGIHRKLSPMRVCLRGGGCFLPGDMLLTLLLQLIKTHPLLLGTCPQILLLWFSLGFKGADCRAERTRPGEGRLAAGEGVTGEGSRETLLVASGAALSVGVRNPLVPLTASALIPQPHTLPCSDGARDAGFSS